jgi:hypothetical protein
MWQILPHPLFSPILLASYLKSLFLSTEFQTFILEIMNDDNFDDYYVDELDEDYDFWLNWMTDGPDDPTPPDGAVNGYWQRKEYENYDYMNAVYPWVWVETE